MAMSLRELVDNHIADRASSLFKNEKNAEEALQKEDTFRRFLYRVFSRMNPDRKGLVRRLSESDDPEGDLNREMDTYGGLPVYVSGEVLLPDHLLGEKSLKRTDTGRRFRELLEKHSLEEGRFLLAVRVKKFGIWFASPMRMLESLGACVVDNSEQMILTRIDNIERIEIEREA